MKRKFMLIGLVVMAVGFAAVSTTLFINGSTLLKANNDFHVYYSDAYVNGVQDLTVIEDDTHISFKTSLDTLGQEYVLDYEVTNGSKSFDSELVMNCTGGNEYLSVVNDFDDDNILESLNSRTGKLTLTLNKSYVGSDLDVEIKCTINASAIERDSIKEDEESPYYVGKMIGINGDTFNIISEDETYVTLLSSFVIDQSYEQVPFSSVAYYGSIFSTNNGWEYAPGPKDIDIYTYSQAPKAYIDGFVNLIKDFTGSDDITGNMVTLKDLKELGCTIDDNYAFSSGFTCENSPYAEWLVSGQSWYTRSADSLDGTQLWYVEEYGKLNVNKHNTWDVAGIRPTIRIPKDVIDQYLEPVLQDPEVFCNSVGYSYGMYKPDTYGMGGFEQGDLANATYVCSYDEEYSDIFGYNIYGDLVYEYDDGMDEV